LLPQRLIQRITLRIARRHYQRALTRRKRSLEQTRERLLKTRACEMIETDFRHYSGFRSLWLTESAPALCLNA
jgi:hypothetical protein